MLGGLEPSTRALIGALSLAALVLSACQPDKPAANAAARSANAAGPVIATAAPPAAAEVQTPAAKAADAPDDLDEPAGAKLTDAERARVEKAYTKAYDTCMSTGEAKIGVHPAMMECTGAELDRQDALLNAAYKTATAKRTDAAAKTRLKSEERAWIKTRDDTCEALGNDRGQMGQLEMADCLVQMTIVRRFELEK